jgi:hypothetical protein
MTARDSVADELSGLSAYSLSLVMRRTMEHEIVHGMTKLYMEGGRPSDAILFVNDKGRILWWWRIAAKKQLALAHLFIKPDNELH